MGGEVKRVKFSEGVTVGAPTLQNLSIGNLVTFSTTTAFLADKGSAAAQGDLFFDSDSTKINIYDSVKWQQTPLISDTTSNLDDVLSSDGSGLFRMSSGVKTNYITSAYTAIRDNRNFCVDGSGADFTVMLLDPTSYDKLELSLENVGATGSVEFKAASSGQFKYQRGIVSSIYLSGYQSANLRSDGTHWVIKSYTPLKGVIQDRKTSGVDGGTSVGGEQVRDLTSISAEATNFLTISSNQATVDRGDYDIRASAPAYVCDRNQLQWVNATDSSIVICGQSSTEDSGVAVQTIAQLQGSFLDTSRDDWELRHYIAVGRATDGLGIDTTAAGNNNASYATFAEIELTKHL